MYTISVGDRI